MAPTVTLLKHFVRKWVSFSITVVQSDGMNFIYSSQKSLPTVFSGNRLSSFALLHKLIVFIPTTTF